MSAHTQGRLVADDSDTPTLSIEGQALHGLKINTPFEDDAWEGDPEAAANMRRIAACWNACEGVSTERLEQSNLGDMIAQITADNDEILSLRAQRDELLAALRELVDAERAYREARGGPWVYKNVPHQMEQRVRAAHQAAHDAIARATP